jgi:hypothetical protein
MAKACAAMRVAATLLPRLAMGAQRILLITDSAVGIAGGVAAATVGKTCQELEGIKTKLGFVNFCSVNS